MEGDPDDARHRHPRRSSLILRFSTRRRLPLDQLSCPFGVAHLTHNVGAGGRSAIARCPVSVDTLDGTVRLTIKARPRSYRAVMPTARDPLTSAIAFLRRSSAMRFGSISGFP